MPMALTLMCLFLIQYNSIVTAAAVVDESCDNKQVLSASMIYFNPREFNHRHHTDRKVFDYVRNFTKDIFSGVTEPIEFKYYPPVFTQPCDKVVDNAAGDLSKGTSLYIMCISSADFWPADVIVFRSWFQHRPQRSMGSVL
jgi:hypothetical protein